MVQWFPRFPDFNEGSTSFRKKLHYDNKFQYNESIPLFPCCNFFSIHWVEKIKILANCFVKLMKRRFSIQSLTYWQYTVMDARVASTPAIVVLCFSICRSIIIPEATGRKSAQSILQSRIHFNKCTLVFSSINKFSWCQFVLFPWFIVDSPGGGKVIIHQVQRHEVLELCHCTSRPNCTDKIWNHRAIGLQSSFNSIH